MVPFDMNISRFVYSDVGLKLGDLICMLMTDDQRLSSRNGITLPSIDHVEMNLTTLFNQKKLTGDRTLSPQCSC
jgi:hypothetical protein